MQTLWMLVIVTALAQAKSVQPASTASADSNRQRDLIQAGMSQLATAQQFGDLEVVRAFVWASNDPKRVLADAAARRLIANLFYHVEAARRFGYQAVDKLDDVFDVPILDGYMLMSVGWNVDGDKATSRAHELDHFNITLRSVNHIWRLDVTPDPAPASVDAAAADIRAKADAISNITKELVDGRITTVAQLKVALSKAGLKRTEN